ncbi:hypothetical protein [Hyphomonas sp.]|uniref:hypothetical protein n=1 Tax=Hyphomonas sp. TaxID=87 RepID=UPI0025BB6E69|nr:hypothetical protein [Hyphomonas sp.]
MEIRSADILDWRERDKRSMAFMKRLLFPVLLLTALAGRVFPGSPGNERRRGMSVVAEASDLTHSIVPWFYVFR